MQQTSAQAYLIIQLGNRWTDILRLQSNQSVVIGRSSDNQIVVRDERVSRKHAEISPHMGTWAVRDLGSRNGTQVNGVSIDGLHALREGETIGVAGCRITFSHSLQAGFSAGRNSQSQDGESLGGQQTAEIDGLPTIVNRRSVSQWSSEKTAKSTAQPAGIKPSEDALSSRWGFFYRLVFDLVTCDSRETAAQTALDRLLEQLGIASGGVVILESQTAPSTPGSPAHESLEVEDALARKALPPMAVLAARQPSGGSYRRVSDFLVDSAIRDKQAVLARNVMDDSKLSMARVSARREIVSIICAPLRIRESGKDRVFGLLHVYSSGDERMLTDQDLDLTVGVADNLAIALARHDANDRLSQSLATSRRKIDLLQEQLEQSTEMVGCSQSLQRVKQEIRRAAPAAATVLVRGESGVGKELVARAIHIASPRRDGPLVCLNCAALAPSLLESELFGHEKGAFTGATDRKFGKFEAADGGTLLLDEIGEMPNELQAKFLRVLEGQPFERLGGNKSIHANVRVIAATNRDLEEAVQAKEFRADLYYRLRVIEIRVPPLRERLEDVGPLVEFFLNQLGHHAGRRLQGIQPEALEYLSRHTWPGNIRELRNVIERAIVLGNNSTIGIEDLQISTLGKLAESRSNPKLSSANDQLAPSTLHVAPPAPPIFEPIPLSELEKVHIFAMLQHVGGNKTKASQLLGIERSTLDRKLKRFDD